MDNKRNEIICLKHDMPKCDQSLTLFDKVNQVSSHSHTFYPYGGSAELYSTQPVTGRLHLCNKKSCDSSKVKGVVKRKSLIGQG